MKYDKLVRNKIPQIINEAGRTCKTRTVSGIDYRLKLEEKLLEEVQELLSATTPIERTEELADILEVMDALVNLDPAAKFMQRKKFEERGGFDEGIVLEEVI